MALSAMPVTAHIAPIMPIAATRIIAATHIVAALHIAHLPVIVLRPALIARVVRLRGPVVMHRRASIIGHWLRAGAAG
jgi:hypothetical protein